MRFWIGKEREGRYKGIRTLFVQSNIIDDEVLDKIEEILKKYSVGQIYFGAGSVEVNSITNSDRLKEITKGKLTSIESFSYKGWHEKNFDHIILNVGVPLSNNISVKIRSPKKVSVFAVEAGYDTCLDDLENDLFVNTDEEIR